MTRAVPGPPSRDDRVRAAGEVLRVALADLPFPASRWQIVTALDIHGPDLRTRAAVQALPERTYRSVDEVVARVADLVRNDNGWELLHPTTFAPTTRSPRPDDRDRDVAGG